MNLGHFILILTSDGTTIKSNSKRRKDKKNKEAKNKLGFLDKSNFDEIPYFSFLTKVLMNHNYINEYDLDILKYNNLFKELLNQYDFELVLLGVNYLIKYSKQNSVPIDDKFDFLKKLIISNLNNLERR